MFAVIELGGKQYRVHKGEYLTVDRVAHDEGATFTPSVVFAADGDRAILDPRELARIKVTAHVDRHLLGKKVRVFTYKPTTGKKRMRGHRSRLTRVTIQEIALPAARRSGAKTQEANDGA